VGALLVLAVVVAVTTALWRAVCVVPVAAARNVERRGRHHRTLAPGLHVVVPFLDRVRPPVDLREQVVRLRGEPLVTEDRWVVHVDAAVHLQVVDPRAADHAVADLRRAVERLAVTTLRTVVGSMDRERTVTARAVLGARVREALLPATGEWGVRVGRVDITAIHRPKRMPDPVEG
jgi:regulator of protease activity HflC (stomatin/prohibitin superfamily)